MDSPEIPVPAQDEFSDRRRLKHPWDYGDSGPVIDADDLEATYVRRYYSGSRIMFMPVYRQTTEERYAKKGR